MAGKFEGHVYEFFYSSKSKEHVYVFFYLCPWPRPG
jgi:hypothetical protein